MTRKDYELIAKAIRNAWLTDVCWNSMVAELGVVLAQDNPRFNYERFKEACKRNKD